MTLDHDEIQAEQYIQREQILLERRTRDAIDALLMMAEALVHIPKRVGHVEDVSGVTFVASMIGQRIVDITHTILGCHRVGIVAVDPETEHLQPVAVVGLSPEVEQIWFARMAEISLLDILVDRAFIERLRAREVILVDMTQPPFVGRNNPYNIRVMLVAPVCVDDQLVGVLYSDYGDQDHTYTEEELALIRTMTRLAVLVIERERAEAERSHVLFALQRANEQLAQINKVQSNFVSVVSHEFRTMLTGIQGFSELMRDEEFSREEIKEYATDINNSTLQLNDMISELLDLERLKSGQMQLKQDLLDLNALLVNVANSTSAITPRHTFHLRLDETLLLLPGDRDKVVLIIANLIGNAVKYSPMGGEIIVSSQLENGFAHVQIQDSGIGIPTHALEQIFIPYYRVEAESSRYITGTGLGLSIVRQVVEMHRGRVWAESTPGEGSVFHVTLPLDLIAQVADR